MDFKTIDSFRVTLNALFITLREKNWTFSVKDEFLLERSNFCDNYFNELFF